MRDNHPGKESKNSECKLPPGARANPNGSLDKEVS